MRGLPNQQRKAGILLLPCRRRLGSVERAVTRRETLLTAKVADHRRDRHHAAVRVQRREFGLTIAPSSRGAEGENRSFKRPLSAGTAPLHQSTCGSVLPATPQPQTPLPPAPSSAASSLPFAPPSR